MWLRWNDQQQRRCFFSASTRGSCFRFSHFQVLSRHQNDWLIFFELFRKSTTAKCFENQPLQLCFCTFKIWRFSTGRRLCRVDPDQFQSSSDEYQERIVDPSTRSWRLAWVIHLSLSLVRPLRRECSCFCILWILYRERWLRSLVFSWLQLGRSLLFVQFESCGKQVF